MQFKVFKILGLLVLKQRYIDKLLALPPLENKPRLLFGREVFPANSRPINRPIGKNERFLHRFPQFYRKADKTFVFACRNTDNFCWPIQRLRHDCRSIRIGVVIDVHPIQPEHQSRVSRDIGRQYGGSRFQRIEYGDRRPLDLRPAHQSERHTGGTLHLAIQHHQQIGIGKLQAARIYENTVLCLIARFKGANFIVVYQLIQLADGGIFGLLIRAIDLRTLLRTARAQRNNQQKQPGNQQAWRCFHTALRPSDEVQFF